ncbi:UDP-glucose 4-epimerase GalE [Candidatus Haliotispira prima]|uniref:UDP-glucose 4-epimerase n=1 Tax=Candidatus Haliotispira prima TaxID=3034016 RepID=A0ABY8MF35_9SPIO|nr:UDP-glucose 4-epimerase GalE [Candidatus Haliotispira prima]
MANILVVGGAGYIGSHTVRYLVQHTDHKVVVCDDLSKGHRQAVEVVSADIPFEQGDLGDGDNIERILRQYRIDLVMHFAASIEVGSSVADPACYYENNFIKVQRLLAAMRNCGVEYFVFSSTAAVFGDPKAEKIDELHPQLPINPYGRSKLMVEWMLKDYELAYGIKSVILRYFNACGADESGVIGQSYQPPTHLISIVLEAALGVREKVTIYGGDWKTPDGSCVRDFIHVNDLAEAHILGLEKMLSENRSADYNLGSGSGYSVREVIAKAKELSGVDFPVEVGPARPGDPARLIAESDKARRELGWEPKRRLHEIVATAWNWEQHKTF